MVVEISCLSGVWIAIGIGILSLVGGTASPKDSQTYKRYAILLGFCVVILAFLLVLSVLLFIFNTSISITAW